jgi:hypothetical protein
MWISVIGSILLAALEVGSDQEDNKRKALGLSLGGQLDFPFGRQGDLLIPVRIWADGAGIWRIIGWEDMKEISAKLRRKTFFRSDTIIESFNVDSWNEHELTDCSGGSIDAYVYLDEKAHGHRPSVLLLVEQGEGIDEIDVIPLHGRREYDKSMIRIRSFIVENEWPDDSIPQTIETGIVPDRLLETRNQILEGKNEVEDALLKSLDKVDRRIGLWARDYIELREQFSLLQGLLSEKDSVESAGPDDEEAVDDFRNSSDEEQIEQFEEEMKNFAESSTFENWKEFRISDIDDQIREACRDIDQISKEEASGMHALLSDLEIDRKNERSSGNVHEWRISVVGAGRYDDEMDTLELRHDDEGRYSYDFDKTSLRFVPERPGAFEALYAAGFIETEGERKKKIGDTVWRFPGGLTGTWEVNSILDRFTPDGTEPLFVFIKIAADHGLLSPYAQKKYEKLLLLWGDENLEELLDTHGVFKKTD